MKNKYMVFIITVFAILSIVTKPAYALVPIRGDINLKLLPTATPTLIKIKIPTSIVFKPIITNTPTPVVIVVTATPTLSESESITPVPTAIVTEVLSPTPTVTTISNTADDKSSSKGLMMGTLGLMGGLLIALLWPKKKGSINQ